jgi:hypothetical protein
MIDLTDNIDESSGLSVVLRTSDIVSLSMSSSRSSSSVNKWNAVDWKFCLTVELIVSIDGRRALGGNCIGWERRWRNIDDNGSRVFNDGCGGFITRLRTDKWISCSYGDVWLLTLS